MKVRIHIDRLVIDGLDLRHGGRGHLRAAVEQELARLVGENGLAAPLKAGIAVPSLPAPGIEASGSPADLAAAIAGAVYRSVGADGAGPVLGSATRRGR
jgi:hypothetical protein